MKKNSLLILLLFFSFCAEKEVEQNSKVSLYPLTRPRMEQYMKVLPLILRESQKFQANPANEMLGAEKFNTLFYNSLFQNNMLANRLKDIGFQNGKVYGQFHNTVLQMFLILQESPNSAKKIVGSIPIIEKKLAPLLLKLAREPNNKQLGMDVQNLQDQLIFYRNLILIDVFYSQLILLNQNA